MSGVQSARHKMLIDGFHSIHDKNSLGWAVLDGKSEILISAAIAAAINRKAGARVAHTEWKRVNLVLLDAPVPIRPNRHLDTAAARIAMRYEAKASQLFDFASAQGTSPEYLGGHLNSDLAKNGTDAGLLFIADVDDPRHHLKYFKGHRTTIVDAVSVAKKHVTGGRLATHETIDCGAVAGTKARIHMLVFDNSMRSMEAS